MSAQMGLFFPYFHFPGDEWVKAAALYWDKMYRIVPGSYSTRRDSAVVKEFSQGQSAFLGTIDPEDFYFVLAEIQGVFLQFIENNTQELVAHYGIEHMDRWPVNPYSATYAPEANSKLAYIHIGKVEDQLKGLLFARKLATPRSDRGQQDTQFMGMHPKLVGVYMAALAEGIARAQQSHPVSNDTANLFAVSGFTFERLAQVLLDEAAIRQKPAPALEPEAVLAAIALRTVIPKNLDAVPAEKILELREKHAGELGRFQAFVQKTVDGLPGLEHVSGAEFIHDHLEAEYKKEIQPKLDALEDAIQSMGFEAIPSIFNMEVKVPALLPALAMLGGATLVNPVLGATAAVALGLLKVVQGSRKQVQAQLRDSDVAYLLHLKEGLTPAGSLDWLEIQARKLALGV